MTKRWKKYNNGCDSLSKYTSETTFQTGIVPIETEDDYGPNSAYHLLHGKGSRFSDKNWFNDGAGEARWMTLVHKI